MCTWWRSVFLVALAASLLLASTFGAENAYACSCVRLSQEEQLQRSDAVFSGEVLDARENTSPAPPGLHLGPVTFDVGESWKGLSEEQVVVLGYGGGGDCGIDFREGERYLVYATYGGQGEDAALTTGICEGTKPLEAAGDDLEALGPADAPNSETNMPGETTEVDSDGSSGSGSGNKARELPRTGGMYASLLVLGTGALVVGGLLVCR